jgi:Domain of unknown function (DUF3859)
MSYFTIVGFLLLFTSCDAQAQTAKTADIKIADIEFTQYGIYTVDRQIQGRDALGINKAAASNVRHAATMRAIPAQIGTTFGFRYRLIGTPLDAPVDLRKVVIFPSPGLMPSPTFSPIMQDEFILHTRIGETSYASYTLEDHFELVPGTWTIEIWYGSRILGTQHFKLVNLDADCGHPVCAGF